MFQKYDTEAKSRSAILAEKEYQYERIRFHPVDILNTNTDSQAARQSVEHVTAPPKILSSSLGHSLLFDQNLGTNASWEWIEKSACASVISSEIRKI